jgi:hypothetical protein
VFGEIANEGVFCKWFIPLNKLHYIHFYNFIFFPYFQENTPGMFLQWVVQIFFKSFDCEVILGLLSSDYVGFFL